MSFIFTRLGIPDIILIEPRRFSDERGFFLETYKESEFSKHGLPSSFKQDNHSLSQKNVLRGLHYQLPPSAQGKLIRVISGSIYDVAVDIRRDSKFFKKWISVELSAENMNILWIPEGFAHGFLSLSDGTQVIYKATAEYDPESERGIMYNDQDLGIEWPVKNPILSKKDMVYPGLNEAVLFEDNEGSDL